jgi:hypothetical protein
MNTEFRASETVKIPVEERAIPIHHYLRQPQRVVQAIADPKLTEQLSEDRYRLKMRPLNFMDLYKFQPTVVLKVWAGDNGVIYLDSQEYDIKGIDVAKHCFYLKVKGQLSPCVINQKIYLKGRADLQVKLQLPPALWITPKPLLEMAGNSLLKSVLLRIKQKLLTQLITDYYHWTHYVSLLENESIQIVKS